MNEKIVVSMTSYPGRIKNVGKSIFALLMKQTLPPDEIHLWLSTEEFPNKETDLPDDLNVILKHSKVILHWLEKNTYVHKRHEYFKIAKDNDCVFLIDDDVFYANDLIETVMVKHNEIPDCIVCYNQYEKHLYKGKKILYKRHEYGPGPNVNLVRWCGQSMIPAKIYPKNILSEYNQNIRNLCSPISDECWFQPWIVFYDIPLYHLNYDWGIDIDENNGKKNGIVCFSHKKDKNGYERRDNWLNAVLLAYPELLNKYEKLFNYKTDIDKNIIVSMTSWPKRIVNVKPVVESILNNTITPTKIICNLSIEEFPNKNFDLPDDLLDLQKNGTFAINWVNKNTKVFKKFIPVIKQYNGLDYYLFNIDDDELYDEVYIETGIKALQTSSAVVIAKRNEKSNNIWGGMFACKSTIFKEDYWENITDELIAESMNDPYTDKYLQYNNISITNILEKHTEKYNEIFPNRQGNVYSPEKKQKVLNIVNNIFKEKFV